MCSYTEIMEKKYHPFETEKKIQAFWDTNAVYAPEHNPGPLWSIDTPPPTVSGALHIGHVFSYTHTDIIARYQRMSGFSVFYPHGFDDNGLATERFVEKKCGVRAHELGRTEFINLCLKETQQTEHHFEQLWRRLGFSMDWRKSYTTIGKSVRALSQGSFIELYRKGFIYRKEEPALFCTTCYTSVAQAELDDKEVESVFNEIIFKTADGVELVVATTRPELLSSCVALLYHPDDTRYQKYAGTKALVPLFDYEVPIIADEEVIPDKGTGLVMCCTFGDTTDIEWFKKHSFTYCESIGRDGRMTERAGFLKGKKVADARKAIIEVLKEKGHLKNQRPIKHMVNTHERCKKEIEYIALPQWFLSLLPYKDTFISLADTISWYPAFMKSRYINWVENISWDWCLSRQRFYGIPFPVWYCAECLAVILPEESQLPVDPQEEKPPVTSCQKCGCGDIIPDTDVMDTWNTSSLTPYICRELYDGDPSTFIPMNMRPQAHDIIRTWAFYTIVKTWMHDKAIPWKDVVISGHVLTPEGSKISKSRANSPLVPENLLKMYPADVVRYWTASGSLGADIAFSETQLKLGQRLMIKLWNAFRFINEHTSEYLNEPLQKPVKGAVNQWILGRSSEAFERYKKYFDAFEYHHALDVVERFFWHDFCDNYLELIKDQLFNPDKYDPVEVKSMRMTLDHVGICILQWFAPFMPYITEVLYQAIYTDTYQPLSVHQTRFADIQVEYEYHEVKSLMEDLLTVVSVVRKLKSDHKLSLSVPISELVIASTREGKVEQVHHELASQEALIKGVCKAAAIEYTIALPGQKSSLELVGDAYRAIVIL